MLLLGNLARLAALTDAAVLLSFMFVNLSLPWLAGQGRTSANRAVRAADLVLPVLALAMCGWLVLHTGRESLAVATGLALLGLLITVRSGARAG